MTAMRYVTVWCDGKDQLPGGTFDCGQHLEGDTAAQVRKDAPRSWLVNLPGGRDLCPRHQDQRDSPTRWGSQD